MTARHGRGAPVSGRETVPVHPSSHQDASATEQIPGNRALDAVSLSLSPTYSLTRRQQCAVTYLTSHALIRLSAHNLYQELDRGKEERSGADAGCVLVRRGAPCPGAPGGLLRPTQGPRGPTSPCGHRAGHPDLQVPSLPGAIR